MEFSSEPCVRSLAVENISSGWTSPRVVRLGFQNEFDSDRCTGNFDEISLESENFQLKTQNSRMFGRVVLLKNLRSCGKLGIHSRIGFSILPRFKCSAPEPLDELGSLLEPAIATKNTKRIFTVLRSSQGNSQSQTYQYVINSFMKKNEYESVKEFISEMQNEEILHNNAYIFLIQICIAIKEPYQIGTILNRVIEMGTIPESSILIKTFGNLI
jgi:pentatricopeptide repeat protein